MGIIQRSKIHGQIINNVNCPSFLAKNSIVQGLENVEAVEGGEALFECYLSKPETYNYNWLIDDEPAKTTENTEMVYFENGLRHILLLKNLTAQDSCRVTFMCSDAVTSAFLTVKGNSSAWAGEIFSFWLESGKKPGKYSKSYLLFFSYLNVLTTQ